MTPDNILRSRPAPRKEDVLFPPLSNHRKTIARVPNGPEADILYAEGYRVAARELVEQTSKANSRKNMTVFPIVYLYRHHIELVLKALIRSGSYLVDEDQISHPHVHSLDLLWKDFRPILKKVCTAASLSAPSDVDILGIDSYIRQLSEVDPDAQSFRYGTNKSGKPSLPNLEHVCISDFAEAMERLADYLGGILCGFSAHEGLKNDMDSG